MARCGAPDPRLVDGSAQPDVTARPQALRRARLGAGFRTSWASAFPATMTSSNPPLVPRTACSVPRRDSPFKQPQHLTKPLDPRRRGKEKSLFYSDLFDWDSEYLQTCSLIGLVFRTWQVYDFPSDFFTHPWWFVLKFFHCVPLTWIATVEPVTTSCDYWWSIILLLSKSTCFIRVIVLCCSPFMHIENRCFFLHVICLVSFCRLVSSIGQYLWVTLQLLSVACSFTLCWLQIHVLS